jgi:hypothetical protein
MALYNIASSVPSLLKIEGMTTHLFPLSFGQERGTGGEFREMGGVIFISIYKSGSSQE